MLSAGAWLWFLGSLRSYLLRAEGGTGTLSTAAFGAGFVGIVVQVLIQAPQSALAMASSGNVEPGLALVMANMAYAFNVIAYVPLAVMLVAVALVRGVAWNRGIPEVVGVAIRGRRDGIPDHVGGHRSRHRTPRSGCMADLRALRADGSMAAVHEQRHCLADGEADDNDCDLRHAP